MIADSIRLPCPRLAAQTIVGVKLGHFVRDYPFFEVEITTDDNRVDLVSVGYDGHSGWEYIWQHGESVHKWKLDEGTSPSRSRSMVLCSGMNSSW